MDYAVCIPPHGACAATPDNPYVIVLADRGMCAMRVATLHSPGLLEDIRIGPRMSTLVMKQVNGVDMLVPKELVIPAEVREKFPSFQDAIDSYKLKLYGPNLRKMQRKQNRKTVEVTEKDFSPPISDIQCKECKETGALSFSDGEQNAVMLSYVMAYLELVKHPRQDSLHITDATAGR